MKSIYRKSIFAAILILSICTINTNVYSQQLDREAKTTNNSPATSHSLEKESVVIGSLKDYSKTLDIIYSDNGFKEVSIGWNTRVDKASPSAKKQGKLGLMDKYGNFILEPIYDKFLNAYEHLTKDEIVTNPRPKYFTNGYMRVVREGKMGLVNLKGEEVIPPIYDYVQEPNEGVSAVYNTADAHNYHIGYWSLEQNKEILKPNTYYARYPGRLTGLEIENGKILQYHDFNGGYAMVYTEPITTSSEVKATLIDKNGANAYGGKEYLISIYFEDYPQKAEVLVFGEIKSYKDYRWRKYSEPNEPLYKFDGEFAFTAGIANKSGVLVEPKYTSGAISSPGEAATFMGAPRYNLQNNVGLISISIDRDKGFLYGGAKGVIRPNGEIVIPFHKTGNIVYDWENELFVSSAGNIYTKTGRLISGNKKAQQFINGYSIAIEQFEFDEALNTAPYNTYVMNLRGEVLNISKLSGGKIRLHYDEYSKPSTAGTFWLKNQNNKWGLFDFSGKAIIPFTYDQVNSTDSWDAKETKYTIVKSGGKQGVVDIKGDVRVPLEYARIYSLKGDFAAYEQDTYIEKCGLLDIANNKIVTKQKYDVLSNTVNMPLWNARLNDMYYIIDENGEEIAFQDASLPQNGLYSQGGAYRDYKGREIIPLELLTNQNLETGLSYWPIIQGDKVVRVSANYLNKTFAYKNYAPNMLSAASPSYIAERRNAHENERTNAINSPYKRTQIHRKEIVNFSNTPNKMSYEVGGKFDITGLLVEMINVYGDRSDITNEVEISINGTTLRDGDPLTQSGTHRVEYVCRGETTTSRLIVNKAGTDAKSVQDGDYYLMLMGKYIVPVKNHLELSDQKPERPFTLTLKSYDSKGRPIYQIAYGRMFLTAPASGNGTQLMLHHSDITRWRVSKYSSFCTMRLASSQSMLVNASGERGDNGTPVIIWVGKGSAPNHAKMQIVAY